MCKKVFFVGLLLSLCHVGYAQVFSEPNRDGKILYYEIRGDGVKVVRPQDSTLSYFSSLGYLVIPDVVYHNGVQYPVKMIDAMAFEECEGLIYVFIPSTVDTIGPKAFGRCKSLEHVSLPSTLKYCGMMAFFECFSLKELTIPQKIEFIGYNAFSRCTSLQTVYYNAENCITGVKKDFSIYPIFGSGDTSLTKIIIGDNVRVLPENVFAYCKYIEKVEVPNSVVSIEKHAFWFCDKVKSITLGERVAFIGDSAFYGLQSFQIEKIVSLAEMPPVVGTEGLPSHMNVNLEKVPVYVPCKSKDLYIKAQGWKDFDIKCDGE